MTLDQAKDAFRKNKAYITAGWYLDSAAQYQVHNTVAHDVLFDAVGEVASWLSASDEHLRYIERASENISTWRK